MPRLRSFLPPHTSYHGQASFLILGPALLVGAVSISHAAAPVIHPAVKSPAVSHPAVVPLTQTLRVQSNACEYRIDPEGIDVTLPRLSWTAASEVRGEGQSAYQILVASTPALLQQDKGDLWNSGKQLSSDNSAPYQGRKLESRQKCYWKVRVWNGKSQPSVWGTPSSWSMGLLSKTDWKAQWITNPVLADSANFPRTPVNCYRSQPTDNQSAVKWITLNLQKEQTVNSVNIRAARANGQNADFPSVMYPLRFKIEAATKADFSDGKNVLDRSDADILDPRREDNVLEFPAINARFIRLTVNKLEKWDVNLYGLALSGFFAYNDGKWISQDALVSCSDSVENDKWSKKYLSDSTNHTVIAPDSPALSIADTDLIDVPTENRASRVPSLRREFNLSTGVKNATLYVSARGFYEFDINGSKVGHQFLLPGFTDYDKRVTYQRYDVTDMLKPGANALGAMLGYGWYAGHMNLWENRNFYGHYPLLLAQLEVETTDGKKVTIATDGSWKTTLSGSMLWSDLLDGEAVDQRRELDGWNAAGYDDKAWTPAKVEPLDATQLVWQRSQPVQDMQELKPVEVKKVANGDYVFDFGQEIAGWCELNVRGSAGTHIRLRHAEIVKPEGDVDMSNLWGTAQQDDYILKDDQSVTLTPHFTYHGFRYVQVSGLTQPPKDSTITAISLHNNTPEAGQFESSNPLYNDLMEASKWTQRNLMFDVPNGCAARSERLGWTGDLRPCVQALIYNMDVASFLEKYAQDLRDAQTMGGQFTDIAPRAHLENTSICVGSPGWADAGVSMPWQVYVNYGDKRLLKEHYAAARAWVEFISAHNPDFIWRQNRGQDWGDWLSAGPATPRVIGSTAFYAHDADLLSRMAGVLGYQADQTKYAQLFGNIKKAFAANFVNADGYISENKDNNDVQGSYALALRFQLLDDTQRPKAVEHLTNLIARSNGHLTTGFWSSIEMMLSLSDNGQEKLAASMLNQEDEPSWGYMLKSGGTTFWESFNANSQNLSLNHWTYSSVGEWLWRYAAGLNADENSPGYKHFTVKPCPSAELNSCDAQYTSIRGPIGIKWQQTADEFDLDLTVPSGSTASVYIPAADVKKIEESGKALSGAVGVKFVRQEGGRTVLTVQSGTYHFVATN